MFLKGMGSSVAVLTALLTPMSTLGGDALRLRLLDSPGVGVLVEDVLGAPVDGAAVTFQLAEGATFASGLRTEVVTTDQKGRAQVRGIIAAGGAGEAMVHISASYQGLRGTLDTRVRASAPQTSARPSFSKKWLWVAVAAGGIGGAAMAVSKRGPGQTVVLPAASYTLPPVTPTLGQPIIVVTNPHP